MKRGGLGLVLATILTVISITISGLFFNPIVRAIPETNDTTTEQTTDKETENTEEDEEEAEESCQEGMAGFGWLFCPGQNLITKLIDGIVSWISESMDWTLLASDGGKQVQEIWENFLSIANIVFAIVFIIMIYSMATSTGLSNYDLKKMLPRLIVTAVIVNISFYICAAFVDLSNIAGKGLYSLIFEQSVNDPGSSWTLSGNIINSVTSTALLVLAIFLFGGTVIIGLAITLIAIAFRQLMLTVLVIISPVAFALYLLPNTEKWGKTWVNMFGSLLLIYPMFTAVWGGSRLVANIFATTGTAGIPGFLMDFLCAIAPALAILPLFRSSTKLMGSTLKTIEGNGGIKKVKSGVNTAGRGLATNSQIADRMRQWGSGRALDIQNTVGNVPVVGSIVRRPGFNQAVNYAANSASKRSEAAIKAGENWAAQNLNNAQLNEVIASGGTYTDTNGRRVTLTDSNKIIGAINKGKKGVRYGSWLSAISNFENVERNYARHGRSAEAQAIRSAYASAMMSEKSAPLLAGSIVGWEDGKWSGNTQAKLNEGVMNFASGLSLEKLAGVAGGDQAELQKYLSNIDSSSLSASNQALYDKAVSNLRDNSQAVLNDAMLSKSIGQGTAKTMEEAQYLRDSSEQSIVINHRNSGGTDINQIYRDFNSGNTGRVTSSIIDARSVRNNQNVFTGLSRGDQQRIQAIASVGPGSSYHPVPVASWE
ncbi:MAG: hypothetical protein Q4C83_00115 [Candidatus Saccharibacteria bacterium]|nr:hypothetical protein [Candidatus Saccharibacteria bacterium]